MGKLRPREEKGFAPSDHRIRSQAGTRCWTSGSLSILFQYNTLLLIPFSVHVSRLSDLPNSMGRVRIKRGTHKSSSTRHYGENTSIGTSNNTGSCLHTSLLLTKHFPTSLLLHPLPPTHRSVLKPQYAKGRRDAPELPKVPAHRQELMPKPHCPLQAVASLSGLPSFTGLSVPKGKDVSFVSLAHTHTHTHMHARTHTHLPSTWNSCVFSQGLNQSCLKALESNSTGSIILHK